jgi:adhesin/invasin
MQKKRHRVTSLLLVVSTIGSFLLNGTHSAHALVFPSGNAYLDKAYWYDGMTYADKTTAAQDLLSNDVTIAQNLSTFLYLGSQSPISALSFYMGTWGTGLGRVSYEYSGPNGFATLPIVSDPGNNFKTVIPGGVADVTFTTPSDWTKTTVGSGAGVNAYWIRIKTNTFYQTNPIATQIKATVLNMKVKLAIDSGGTWDTAFTPTLGADCGGAGQYWGEALLGSGVHAYAVRTDGGNCTLSFTSEGFLTSSITGHTLTSTQQDFTATALVLTRTLKATVSDELGNALSDATLSYSGLAPSVQTTNTYYFNATNANNLPFTITRSGYVTENGTGQNTALANVSPGVGTMQTTVTLAGSTACTGNVAPGAHVTCAGMQRDFAITVQANNINLTTATVTLYKDAAHTQLADDLSKTGTADASGPTTNGIFRAALAGGTYYYVVSASGYIDASGTTTVVDGNSNTVTIGMNVQPALDTNVSATQSTISVGSAQVTADNVATSFITVTAKNAAGTVLNGKTVTLASSLAGSSIFPASGVSDANGVATFLVKSGTIGTTTLTSIADGVTLSNQPTISFVASAPANTTVSATQSTVSLSPASANADGVSAITATVIAKNSAGTPLAGKAVSLSYLINGQWTTFSVKASDANGVATFPITSWIVGSVQASAVVDGVVISGSPTAQFVAAGVCPFTVGLLVKLPDDGNPATQQDSAVYYYGKDCKRHAFSNSKVYFSWYADFSGVQVVSSQTLASMSLGKNVTYRPGTKMVKFQSLNNVYVAAKGGALRWVKTEAAASGLYGANWNKNIDDISDAFYLDYNFGTDVNTASDFNIITEQNNTPTISENF